MLRFYNTLTNQKEEFETLEKGKVKMYTCGPTVYDYAHIGNFAAYLYADTLRRYLEYSGYEIKHIVNITDVGHLTEDDVNQADSGDDKMLKASLREKKTPQDIANFYTEYFFADIEKLNILKAHYYPRATAHIKGMIRIVEGLIKKGLAYEKNGNVFFDVTKFESYGKLSNKKLDELKAGARLEDHPDKNHPFDFALWLNAPKEHILKWESPWGLGYPGWHIECSAMSMEYLGDTLDIHTGGEDHVFPHHENEIAQSEGYTGKPFAHFWFHNHFLLVDGGKMSKSSNNFYTLKDVLGKGYDPMVFRLLVISSHYRSNLNFTWTAMDQAKTNLEKIVRFLSSLRERFEGAGANIDLESFQEKFQSAMDDDINSPLALSVVYELISEVNKNKDRLSAKEAKEILKFWEKINEVLGLRIETEKKKIPKEIQMLVEQRQKAREEKDFEKADQLREEISAKGYVIEDTMGKQKVMKK